MQEQAYLVIESTYEGGNDAPPSSLMDSTTNPKMKTTEGEGVEARSLACNTSGYSGMLELPDGDLEDSQASQLLTQTCTNQTTSWLMCN
jgi:hypothetical protein